MNNSLEQTGRIRKFNPGTFQSDKEVIRQFVVRKRELDGVLEILRNNMKSQSCQHVLLVAPRGRGKTMLLARVAAELRTNARLSGQLLPVRFMEESHEIFDLGDFWLETLFYLSRDKALEPEITSELRDTHAALAARNHDSEIEQRARAAVLETADRLGKKLVLMVENLQALCRDTDGDFGWKLRKVLQSEPQIILLATATSHFSELEDVENAFFRLFRIMHLLALDTDECRHLWEMVTGSEVRENVIRPLQILTGGDPRLLVIIGEFAYHQSLRQLMEDLVRLIDDHTEYFRSHLEGIGKSERRVYLALIDLWQPSSTGEIATRARMDIRVVSTMLGRLADRGAVIAEGNGKKRYVSTQRLYSIYYKLRRERDDASVVSNLIRFMEKMYDEDKLSHMARRLLQEASQSRVILDGIMQAIIETPKLKYLFFDNEFQALNQIDDRFSMIYKKIHKPGNRKTVDVFIEKNQGQAIEKTEKGIESRGNNTQGLPEQPMVQAIFNNAIENIENRKFDVAISDLEQAVKLIGDNKGSEENLYVSLALFIKGIIQGELGNTRAEIATYDTVIERFCDSGVPNIQIQVALSLINKAVKQIQLGDTLAGITTYDTLIERFGDIDVPEIQIWIASALFDKGVAQVHLGDTRAGIATYDTMLERYGDSDDPEFQIRIASALFNKGVMQVQLGDVRAGVNTYDKLIERFGDIDVPEIQIWIASALFGKGVAQIQLGDARTGIATYETMIERFGGSEVPEIQIQIASVLFNKGVMQVQLGDARAGINTYDKMIERFGGSEVPEIQLQIASALCNKGIALGQLGNAKAGIATCDMVIERFSDSDVPEIQIRIASALCNKGIVQGQLGDPKAEIATCDTVIERFGDSEVPEIQLWVASALYNKGVAQGKFGDARAGIATYDTMVERFGNSDVPEIQIQIASALYNKGVAQGKLGDVRAGINAYDKMIERFGDSEVPEIQLQIASALCNKGIMQDQIGDVLAGIATYDTVIERFGDSDVPEIQIQIASALFDKGVMQGLLVDARKGITTYDTIIERFGDSDVPRIQSQVAKSLICKAEIEIQLGCAEEALNSYDELKLRNKLMDDPEVFKRPLRWIKTQALFLLGKNATAMGILRSVYADYINNDEEMIYEMLEQVPNLIAFGASASDLVEILSSDNKKAEKLVPLLVALRQLSGEVVRAPVEVMETAGDILNEIESRINSRADQR